MYGVVIIDDNKLTANMLRRTVDWFGCGCCVQEVDHDGKKGLEAIRRHQPDIVITDIRMPGMDGLKMVDQALKLVPHTKIIFISAYNDFEYAYRAIKLRAFDYLLKPFSSRDLQNVVQRAAVEIKKEQEARHRQAIKRNQDPEFSVYPLLVRNLLVYIQDHLAEDFTLNTLARQFAISPSYISTLVKRHTRLTYLDYVREQRMRAARELLLDPRLRVSEVAQMVGYHSYVTFYRAFSRYESLSPSDYRNRSNVEESAEEAPI